MLQKMREKFISSLGVLGGILYYILSIAVIAFPFYYIRWPVWAIFVYALVIQIVPFVSDIAIIGVWTYGFILVSRFDPLDVVGSLYVILAVLIFVRYLILFVPYITRSIKKHFSIGNLVLTATVIGIVICAADSIPSIPINLVIPATSAQTTPTPTSNAYQQFLTDNKISKTSKAIEEREFKVAGVTFKNGNGEKRQDILKEAMKEYGNMKECPGGLMEYKYKGHPAIYVLLDGKIIGNIPAEDVDDVLDIMPEVDSCTVYVGSFKPEGKLVYYSRVVLRY